MSRIGGFAFPRTFPLVLLAFLILVSQAHAQSNQLRLDPFLTGQSASPLAKPVPLPFDKILPSPITDYALLTFESHWAGVSYKVYATMLTDAGYAERETDGRSCLNAKPYWMLYNTKTNQGMALFLAYSGNWSFQIKSQNGQVSLHLDTLPGGLPAFAHIGGLPIPGALTDDFTGGWDYGAQPMIHYIRAKLERDHGSNWPWVQYNTWYGFGDNLSEKVILDTIPKVAALGCELFTIDAGWYGTSVNPDWQGGNLGDWQVNPARFPHGLGVIADAVHRAGMKFGLWFEIECASSTSHIAQTHPDWFLPAVRKDPHGYRAILDLGNPAVLDYLDTTLDHFVNEDHLDYIKLDFNTNLNAAQGSVFGKEDMVYAHYRGLVSIWKHLRSEHPSLVIENCSSGSLRQDLMPAAFTDTHWVSDMVNNSINLAMGYGCTYLFPPEMCSHWTALPDNNDPAMDLEAQFAANMMGHFGVSGTMTGHFSISGKTYNWDPATLQVLTRCIALYKDIRPILRRADVYHITPQIDAAHPHSVQAVFYVDPSSDQALLFAFQGGDSDLSKTLRLPGLRPDALYRVIWPDGFGNEQVLTGRQLLDPGLTVTFPHPGACGIIRIEPKP